MVRQAVGYESEEMRKLGAVLAALVEVREEEILSSCKDVLDAAFSDSVGRMVIDVLLASQQPLSLRSIAAKCDSGRRSVLPEGPVRRVVDRLAAFGIVVNLGSSDRPRYLLNDDDRRVQYLQKMYGPLHFAAGR